jgi:hypothetical protein
VAAAEIMIQTVKLKVLVSEAERDVYSITNGEALWLTLQATNLQVE